MEIKNIMGYKSAFGLTKMIAIVSVVVMAVGLLAGYSIMVKQMEDSRNSMVIIDRKGNMFDADEIKYAQGRRYEYESQSKMVFNLWYGLDENSYDRNIEQALYLLGNCGKEMVDSYNQQQIKEKMMQKNFVMVAEVEGVEIDMFSKPVKGVIVGKQIVKRDKNEIARRIKCEFYVIDTDRSTENPHGCKLEGWKIVASERL